MRGAANLGVAQYGVILIELLKTAALGRMVAQELHGVVFLAISTVSFLTLFRMDLREVVISDSEGAAGAAVHPVRGRGHDRAGRYPRRARRLPARPPAGPVARPAPPRRPAGLAGGRGAGRRERRHRADLDAAVHPPPRHPPGRDHAHHAAGCAALAGGERRGGGAGPPAAGAAAGVRLAAGRAGRRRVAGGRLAAHPRVGRRHGAGQPRLRLHAVDERAARQGDVRAGRSARRLGAAARSRWPTTARRTASPRCRWTCSPG